MAEQGLGYPNGALAEQGHQLASVNLQLWEVKIRSVNVNVKPVLTLVLLPWHVLFTNATMNVLGSRE